MARAQAWTPVWRVQLKNFGASSSSSATRSSSSAASTTSSCVGPVGIELLLAHALAGALGEEVREVARDAEVAGDVADAGAGLHRRERHDLRHGLAAEPVDDVLQHVLAAVLGEVEVDVGRRHALGVDEALEEQVVLDGVDVRDPQQVGHDRAGGGATARPDPDPHALARRR